MEKNSHNKNKRAKEKMIKRRQELLNLLSKNDFQSHEEVIEALKKLNISVSQSTISRDMDDLGIKKNKEGYYKPSKKSEKDLLMDTLKNLLESNNTNTFTTVATYFMKTDEGKAQEIAYYLRKSFDDSILATNVGLDYIILFVDAENPPKELLELFEDSDLGTV